MWRISEKHTSEAPHAAKKPFHFEEMNIKPVPA